MHQPLRVKICQLILLATMLLASVSSAHASDWLNEGWQRVEQNKHKDALTSWQQGVNQLRDSQLLIVLSLTSNLDSAITLARKAGRAESAFVLQSEFQGEPTYYVLSSRQASLNPVERHQQLTSLRERIGVTTKLFSDSAKKFKSVKTPVADEAKKIDLLPRARVAQIAAAGKPVHDLNSGGEDVVDKLISNPERVASKSNVEPVMVAATLVTQAIPALRGGEEGSESDKHLGNGIDSTRSEIVGGESDIDADVESTSLSSMAANARDQTDSSELDFSQIDSDIEVGRLEESLWGLEDLLKIHPDHGAALHRLGKVQEEMLDSDAAIAAYQKAVKTVDDPARTYSRLGSLFYSLKRYREAIVTFEQVLKLKPDSASAQYMIGMTYMSVPDYDASIKAFKRAVELDKAYAQQALYGESICYIRLGKGEEAKALLEELIALDPTSEVATNAKQALVQATALAEISYFSLFGLYGFQYDSNVVLKPSTSPNVPVITGVKDFEHTLLSVLTYAPPPASNGMGYKASTMVYAMLHDRLSTFDMVVLDLTVTPYISIGKNNVLSMDAAFDYIFFNYKRYMDTIKLKPILTYTPHDQLKIVLSETASRANYYQPVLLQTSLQDGWVLREDLNITGYSKDHKSSIQLGGYFTTSRSRGSDWSYNAYGVSTGFDVPVPYVEKLTAGIHGSIERQKYQNIAAGAVKRRRDTIYNGSVSISYPFSYVNVSITGSYAHGISNTDVYSYVRMMTGINISGSY